MEIFSTWKIKAWRLQTNTIWQEGSRPTLPLSWYVNLSSVGYTTIWFSERIHSSSSRSRLQSTPHIIIEWHLSFPQSTAILQHHNSSSTQLICQLISSWMYTFILTRTLTYSLTHSSITHTLTRSLTNSLTRTLTHSLTHTLTHSLTHSLSN